MKYLIIIMALFVIITASYAQVYTKESDTALKVTAPVDTIYEVSKIKERIVDLNDYIFIAEANILSFQKEIEDLNKLLVEAGKVGIDTTKAVIADDK